MANMSDRIIEQIENAVEARERLDIPQPLVQNTEEVKNLLKALALVLEVFDVCRKH